MERRIALADEASMDAVEIDIDAFTASERKMVLIRPYYASHAEAARALGLSEEWVRRHRREHANFERALEMRADHLPQIIRAASAQLIAKNMLLLAEAAEVNTDGSPKHGWNVFFKAQEETRRLAQVSTTPKEESGVTLQQVQMFSYGDKKSDNET
jgi:hypothetical protein